MSVSVPDREMQGSNGFAFWVLRFAFVAYDGEKGKGWSLRLHEKPKTQNSKPKTQNAKPLLHPISKRCFRLNLSV
jgi:hypothetical protein